MDFPNDQGPERCRASDSIEGLFNEDPFEPMEGFQDVPGSEFTNEANLDPTLPTIDLQATAQSDPGQQNNKTEQLRQIYLGYPTNIHGFSAPVGDAAAKSSDSIDVGGPTTRPTATRGSNPYGLNTVNMASGPIDSSSPLPTHPSRNVASLVSSGAALHQGNYHGAYGASPGLVFVTPRNSVSPRFQTGRSATVQSKGYHHPLPLRPAPSSSNQTRDGSGHNPVSSVGYTEDPAAADTTATAATMGPARKRPRPGPTTLPGVPATSGAIDIASVKQEDASSPDLESVMSVANTPVSHVSANAPPRSRQQVAQGRLCSALSLVGTEATPSTAPTTLPGEPKHRHKLLSSLIDNGHLTGIPDHLLKTCRGILERPLTDPNLGPAPRMKMNLPERMFHDIPEGASAETRKRLEAKNKRAEKIRSRESNRLSAERKRFREHQHRDLSGQKIAELEPERNFWMAVAVAHGADENL
ncbi:hypothetical protein VUR80DRAFT_9525 [Thermomyces stellatus]